MIPKRSVARILKVCLFCLGSLLLFAFASGCGNGVIPAGGGPSAQPSAVKDGPQLGYVWSAAERSLRPILGVAGSSQIGKSVVSMGVYVNAAAAGSSGLLEASDGMLVALHLPSPTLIPVASGLAANVTLRLSPSGNSAVAYAANGASILLVTGLPDAPKTQTLTAPASLLSAAVGDSASVVAASSAGTSVTISVAHAGQPTSVMTVGQLGGLSFVPASDDAVLVDGSRNSLAVLRNVQSAPATQSIALSGLNQPVAVAVSRDGQWAVVANSGDKSLVRVDLAGASAAVKIACDCQPTRVESLDGNAVFRVTDIGDGPTWMIDADQVTPRTLFIPAFRAAANAGGAR